MFTEAGVRQFIRLLDAPSSYSGKALFGVRVNAGATGLEFASMAAYGDVFGPASSTDYALALFNGTTGKLLRSGVVTSNASGDLLGINLLGVGTSSPTARIQISGATLLSTNSLLINTTHTGSFVSVVNINPQKTGFDTSYFSCLSFEPQLNTDASVTVGDLWGITGNPRLLNASNVTRAVAFRANIQHTSSGIVTNAYQFLANGITKTTGQITNAYGLYVNDLAGVGTTLNYAVFTAGTTPSLFTGGVTAASYTVPTGGAFRTGTTAANTALAQAYDVDGVSYTTFITLTANNTPTCTLSNVTSSTAFNPTTTDGAALGTSSVMWSDAFFASGAVLNFNNGDVTVTHAADTLTVAGGTLVAAGSGLTNAFSVTGTTVTYGASITSTHTASFSAGLSCTPTRTGTNTGWFAGLTFEAKAQTDTSVTLSDLWGCTGNARVDSATNVTRASGFRGTVQHTSSGTTAIARGFHQNGITKSAGTITKAYGFYSDDLAGVASSENWGFYSAGAGTPSFFQGLVGFGKVTTAPIATLDVQQNAVATGTPYVMYVDGAAHTTLTATEMNDVYWSLGRTAQFATGNITNLRTVRIAARTYSAVGASTYTNVATLYVEKAPVAGANVTMTNTYALWMDAGASRFDGRVLQTQGADIASANDLTLGEDGNSWEITGTTQINAITIARWQNGSMVTLLFTSTPTVKHNTAGGAGTVPILLAGAVDFAATAGDTLTLLLSEIGGTQCWREIGRAVI